MLEIRVGAITVSLSSSLFFGGGGVSGRGGVKTLLSSSGVDT
jgi:hypothetical protein